MNSTPHQQSSIFVAQKLENKTAGSSAVKRILHFTSNHQYSLFCNQSEAWDKKDGSPGFQWIPHSTSDWSLFIVQQPFRNLKKNWLLEFQGILNLNFTCYRPHSSLISLRTKQPTPQLSKEFCTSPLIININRSVIDQKHGTQRWLPGFPINSIFHQWSITIHRSDTVQKLEKNKKKKLALQDPKEFYTWPAIVDVHRSEAWEQKSWLLSCQKKSALHQQSSIFVVL